MALMVMMSLQVNHHVFVVHLINKGDLVKNNSGFIVTAYRIQSDVTLEGFRKIVSALEDRPLNTKERNCVRLSQRVEDSAFKPCR
jgi:hypothetical protein